MEVVSDAGMQFRLVARRLLVLLRELNDLDRPWHLARTQNIHNAVVIEAHAKVELLQNSSVASSGDFGLK